MKEHKIDLLQEEIEALLAFNEVEIFNDDNTKIIIFINPDDKENINRYDILSRYNNEEYWRELPNS